MINMYNNIQPFSFDDLLCSEKKIEVEKEFTGFFDSVLQEEELVDECDEEGIQEDPPPPPVDIEKEARMVFENAYAQGEKAGIEFGRKKMEPVIKRFEQAVYELEQFQLFLERKTEETIIDLSLFFAEGVILKECSEHKGQVEAMIRKALSLCKDKNKIIIRVRKDDFDYLSEIKTEAIKIVPDDTIEDAGFIIETQYGEIDGTISMQMEELRREYLPWSACRTNSEIAEALAGDEV